MKFEVAQLDISQRRMWFTICLRMDFDYILYVNI